MHRNVFSLSHPLGALRYNGAVKLPRLLLRLALSAALVAGLAVGFFSYLLTMGAPVRLPVAVPEGFPPGERFTATTSDGVSIAGHYFPPRIATAAVVLFAHGIYHDRFQEAEKARLALDLGLGACLVDLRAHGESGGSVQTLGLREAEDLRAAAGWLARAGRTRLIGHGFSLGAAACAHYQARGGVFSALVLQAPFADHERTVRLYAKRWYYIPDFLSPLVTATLALTAWRLGARGEELDPADLARLIRCPTLVAAGAADPRAPVADAIEIAANLAGTKELLVVPDCDHNDFTRHPEFMEALRRFYARHGL